MNKEYIDLIASLKSSIIQSRYAAARIANKEQLMLYFRTGKMLSEKIAANKWGMKIIEKISEDLQVQLPGLRGFSHRNLLNMKRFYTEYQDVIISQSLTAKLDGLSKDQLFWEISFTHHILILSKCASPEERMFYIEQASTQHWSLIVLEHHIDSNLFSTQGKLPNNFSSTLSAPLKESALKVFQDEYLMDFLSPGEVEDERVLEDKVIADIKNFIVRMGKGFCFIGNQHRIEVEGDEFFIDLLFFNRHLQCLVAFELKRGKFRPEYAGQLNFYLNVLDEKVKLATENPSIGIILCKEKSNTVVEFAVKNIDKAMGVATYRTTRELPEEMRGLLPDASKLAELL